MGTMTVTDIVNEGCLLAGDTSLSTRAKVELKAWLRSQYRGFLWPFLKREISNAALNAGASSFTLGAGVGGVTQHLQRVNDPVFIYPTDLSSRSKVRIHTDFGDSVMQPVDVSPAPSGLPTMARVVHTGTPGQRKLEFNLAADRAYILRISYYMIPTDPGDSEVPLYENDRTMIQAVNVFVLKYKKDDTYEREAQILVAMVNEDRLKYGSEPGMNDSLFLDPRVFR